MTTLHAAPGGAQEAYDVLAPAYDLLTGAYAYDRWLSALEELALDHGLAGRRLLDVACGTGASFLPMLTRGYEVTACDISSRMLAVAREKAADALLFRADMRELPRIGQFDLITCIDDALNYVLEAQDLQAVLAGIARNLASHGLAVWDLNTVAQYQGQFASDHIVVDDDTFIGWRSGGPARLIHGEIVEVVIDVFRRRTESCWQRSSSIHRQRHWPRATVEQLCRRAGLEVLDVRGQFPAAVIADDLDESAHTKAIYVVRLARKEAP
jgi:ubiquinone/menaquinone biosynthesis C-methylase UbiE